MINWIKYDQYSRSIESHVDHLITDGKGRWIAQHVKINGHGHYGWVDENNYVIRGITHWSPINLPGEETTDDIQTNQS